MEDSEIVTLFGEEATRRRAFNELIQKYQKKIYWLCRRIVIDHDDADDITQEVFVKVWLNLADFKQNSKLYTWLYRIAFNECVGFLRKKRRRYFLPIGDVEGELTGKLQESLQVSEADISFQLQKALLGLPEKQRLVFNMKYFDDLPYEEIAHITGTSVGALKASYHFAVKKVETTLKQSLNF